MNLLIPIEWKVTWNHLDLLETEMTAFESLFCATYSDFVIFVDYGSRNDTFGYRFALHKRSEKIFMVEDIFPLSRADAIRKLQHWLNCSAKLGALKNLVQIEQL